MKWLVILDPIEGLFAETDTSVAIINKARTCGVTVDVATIEHLFFAQYATVIASDEVGCEQVRALNDYDLILMRKEPPYDLAFHYATQLLSLAEIPVVNSPSSLRDYNEKLMVLPFKDCMPPTLVSSDPQMIMDFLARYDGGIIKSLDSFQGKSVQRIKPTDLAIISSYTNAGKQPVMVQEFIENIYEGDKRVIMLGDRLLGAVMRRPRRGYHANFANSDALHTELSIKERQVILKLGPWLVKHGIHFSGLDFIGEQLTEINITCPTGIVQISKIENRDLAREIVEYLLRLIAK